MRNCFARTSNVIEERNVLSGFRAHSSIPKSEASVLLDDQVCLEVDGSTASGG